MKHLTYKRWITAKTRNRRIELYRVAKGITFKEAEQALIDRGAITPKGH